MGLLFIVGASPDDDDGMTPAEVDCRVEADKDEVDAAVCGTMFAVCNELSPVTGSFVPMPKACRSMSSVISAFPRGLAAIALDKEPDEDVDGAVDDVWPAFIRRMLLLFNRFGISTR